MDQLTRNQPRSRPRTAAARALNRLIVACEEDILVERDAALGVRDGGYKDRLEHQTRQRRAFVGDLGAAVVGLGGVAASGAGALARVRSVGRRARAVLAGWHEGDGYKACAAAERRTVKAYADALSAPLSDDARFGVQRQLTEITHDLEEAIRLRGQH